MTIIRKLAVGLVIALVFAGAGCQRLTGEVDAKFGDQHFKTAVALVELYHVRHGVYPASLQEPISRAIGIRSRQAP